MGETLVARCLGIALILTLTGCGPASVSPTDPTKDPGYAKTIAELNGMNSEADKLFRGGKPDPASALIQKGQPLVKRLLDVPHPSLEAVEAASDLDDLYGRMLLSNRHYGWAMLQFQKNHARWKTWNPPTPETELRLKQADAQIAECDRLMTR